MFSLKYFHKPNISFFFGIKPTSNLYQIKGFAFNFSEELKPQQTPKKFIDETPEKEILKIDEKLFFNLNEYKQALFYFSNGKYRISQEFYKRVLNYLENDNEKNSDNYIYILKKKIINANLLKDYKKAEKNIEKIIEIYQGRGDLKTAYRHYNNLLLHLLKTDIKKAIKICQALISEKERVKIPNYLYKFFIFNLGTAYLLKGNIVDAKNRLRECLILQPNYNLKGYALNNLAVASWWHKSPNFREQSSDSDSESNSPKYPLFQNYPTELIETDFNNVLSLLKSSINHIEKVDFKPEGENKEKLKKLLDDETLFKGEQKIELLLEKKDSKTPLLNLSEFLYFARPDKSAEATFWIRYTLKFFEKYDPLHMDRCIISVAQICKTASRIETAENLFRKALEMLEESDSYNKALCLLLYGKMLKEMAGRAREGENLISQSYALGSNLPSWSNKLSNTLIPDLDL